MEHQSQAFLTKLPMFKAISSPNTSLFSELITRSILHLIGCTLPLALLWGGEVRAQVGISPLVIEKQVDRGQAQATINVTNNTNEPFRARIYVEPFTYNREKGFEILPSSPRDLTPYLQFSPRELEVPPGVSRRVRLIVRFPPSLPEGEYRSVIFTENLKEVVSEDAQGNITAIATRIGVILFVRKGNIAPNLAVTNASWDSNRQQIQLVIQNSGQASAYPTTSWTLKQGGATIRTGNTSPSGVIAESERLILLPINSSQNETPLPPGVYQLTGELIGGTESQPTKTPFSVNLTIPAQ